jgi:hypothetical protein
MPNREFVNIRDDAGLNNLSNDIRNGLANLVEEIKKSYRGIEEGMTRMSRDMTDTSRTIKEGSSRLNRDFAEFKRDVEGGTRRFMSSAGVASRSAISFLGETFTRDFNKPALWSRDLAQVTGMAPEPRDMTRAQARMIAERNWRQRGEQFGDTILREGVGLAAYFVPGVGLPVGLAYSAAMSRYVPDKKRMYEWDAMLENTSQKYILSGISKNRVSGVGWSESERRDLSLYHLQTERDNKYFKKEEHQLIANLSAEMGYFNADNTKSIADYKQNYKRLLDGTKEAMKVLHISLEEAIETMGVLGQMGVKDVASATRRIGVTAAATGMSRQQVMQYAQNMGQGLINIGVSKDDAFNIAAGMASSGTPATAPISVNNLMADTAVIAGLLDDEGKIDKDYVNRVIAGEIGYSDIITRGTSYMGKLSAAKLIEFKQNAPKILSEGVTGGMFTALAARLDYVKTTVGLPANLKDTVYHEQLEQRGLTSPQINDILTSMKPENVAKTIKQDLEALIMPIPERPRIFKTIGKLWDSAILSNMDTVYDILSYGRQYDSMLPNLNGDETYTKAREYFGLTGNKDRTREEIKVMVGHHNAIVSAIEDIDINQNMIAVHQASQTDHNLPSAESIIRDSAAYELLEIYMHQKGINEDNINTPNSRRLLNKFVDNISDKGDTHQPAADAVALLYKEHGIIPESLSHDLDDEARILMEDTETYKNILSFFELDKKVKNYPEGIKAIYNRYKDDGADHKLAKAKTALDVVGIYNEVVTKIETLTDEEKKRSTYKLGLEPYLEREGIDFNRINDPEYTKPHAAIAKYIAGQRTPVLREYAVIDAAALLTEHLYSDMRYLSINTGGISRRLANIIDEKKNTMYVTTANAARVSSMELRKALEGTSIYGEILQGKERVNINMNEWAKQIAEYSTKDKIYDAIQIRQHLPLILDTIYETTLGTGADGHPVTLVDAIRRGYGKDTPTGTQQPQEMLNTTTGMIASENFILIYDMLKLLHDRIENSSNSQNTGTAN